MYYTEKGCKSFITLCSFLHPLTKCLIRGWTAMCYMAKGCKSILTLCSVLHPLPRCLIRGWTAVVSPMAEGCKPGMGIVPETANFHSSENYFLRRKTTVRGEKKLAVQKERNKKGSTGFSSTPKTCKTYQMRSHAAIARLVHVIVNTVT